MISVNNFESMKKLGIPFGAVENTFKHFTDPGHGWFRVSRQLLKRMDLLEKISSYSYQKNKWVYLEEDCDATLFFNRYEELFGESARKTIRVIQNISDNPSSIRNYFQYGG